MNSEDIDRFSNLHLCTLIYNIIVNLSRRRSGVIIVNLEHISPFVLVFLLVDFEQVNVSWVGGKSMKQSKKIKEKLDRAKKL